jgi:hypothetical protein
MFNWNAFWFMIIWMTAGSIFIGGIVAMCMFLQAVIGVNLTIGFVFGVMTLFAATLLGFVSADR